VDVLLVRAGALGDVLLLRTAVASARRAGHRVVLVSPSVSGSVLVGPGEARALVPLDGAEMARALAGEPGDALRDGLRADLAVALTRSPDLHAVLRPLVGRLVTRDPEPPAPRHAAAWAAEALEELGVPAALDVAPMVFGTEERAQAATIRARLPARFLALHPGSGSPTKNWPADRFASIAARLSRGEPFLVVAGPADRDAVAPLRAVRGAVVAEGLPARVLGALLSEAGLYVGNDSGVTHLAAASGATTLALFGPTDPASWAPLGRAVRVLRSADRTMAGLEVDEVERAARLGG